MSNEKGPIAAVWDTAHICIICSHIGSTFPFIWRMLSAFGPSWTPLSVLSASTFIFKFKHALGSYCVHPSWGYSAHTRTIGRREAPGLDYFMLRCQALRPRSLSGSEASRGKNSWPTYTAYVGIFNLHDDFCRVPDNSPWLASLHFQQKKGMLSISAHEPFRLSNVLFPHIILCLTHPFVENWVHLFKPSLWRALYHQSEISLHD